MLGRAKTHRRGRSHIQESLRRKCTPLVLVSISVTALVLVFLVTGLSRGVSPGAVSQPGAEAAQPQHRFLEGQGFLTQSEAAEPEKYFVTKDTSPDQASDGISTPSAKPKLGFYFQKDIPEHLLSSTAPAGLLPQLQKVAKHKAAEGKGGKMGFYFAHDIPEEIKASGDATEAAAAGTRHAQNSGKSLKQQQQPQSGTHGQQFKPVVQLQGRSYSPPSSSAQQHASSELTVASSQQHDDPLQQSHQHFGIQTQSSSLASADLLSSQQQESKDGPASLQSALGKAQQVPVQRSQNGLETGTGSLHASRKELQHLPPNKPPLGYYFAVPEGVKAANDQLFRDPQITREAAADSGPKGPLGYYFSKDVSDGAKRKGNWRARLLQSHLQPDAIHVNPF